MLLVRLRYCADHRQSCLFLELEVVVHAGSSGSERAVANEREGAVVLLEEVAHVVLSDDELISLGVLALYGFELTSLRSSGSAVLRAGFGEGETVRAVLSECKTRVERSVTAGEFAFEYERVRRSCYCAVATVGSVRSFTFLAASHHQCACCNEKENLFHVNVMNELFVSAAKLCISPM